MPYLLQIRGSDHFVGILRSRVTLRNPQEYDKEQSLPLNVLSGSSDVETLSDVELLTHAGYLTIKSVEFGDTVFLGYPNKEVKRAIAQLYLEQLLNGKVPGQVGA